MRARQLRSQLGTAAFAAVLSACGAGDAAERDGGRPGSAAPVYTSEVESVSRWIRGGAAGGDTTALAAAPNPQGEGVLVYSRTGDTASGGERAAWVVVDSQVVPLNRAARRATPELPEREDDATAQRIGIRRSGGEADLRGVLPPEEPAPRGEAPPAAAPPADPAPRAEAAPAPRPPRRTDAPRDTVRVPAAPNPRPAVPLPVPRDTPAAEAEGPLDTLHLSTPSRPVRDTIRIPGPSAEPAPAGGPAAG